MNTWQRDTQTNEHHLAVNDDLFWKVYKTRAGDYALTLHDVKIGHGGDVDYFDKLPQAKKEAEQRKATEYLYELAHYLELAGITVSSIYRSNSEVEDSAIHLDKKVAVNVPLFGRTAHVAITVLRNGGWLSTTIESTRQEYEFELLLADIKKAQGSK